MRSANKIKTFETSNSPAEYTIDWSHMNLVADDLILSEAFISQMSDSVETINISANKLEITPEFISQMKSKRVLDL